MFQLYKSRNFSEYFHDTFTFLKTHIKHFFKNFFIVNGFFLLIIITILYFFYKIYQDVVINDMIIKRNPDALANYFNENLEMAILIGSIGFLILVVVSIINYAFVPIYFKLYEKHGGQNFESKEIFDELKANIGKLIIFIIASIPVGLLTMLVAGIVGLILMITIIGIPLLLVVGAFISMFFHATLMEYLNTEKGVFECFSYGLSMCFQKFLHAIGAISVFILIVFVFQMAVGIIQVIITSILGITTLSDPNSYQIVSETWSFQFVILLIFQLFSYLISLMTSATIQINQAIVYYSLKEEQESIHTKSTIDEIGSGQ